MTYEIETKVKELEERIKGYQEALTALNELLPRLTAWERKIIDKRFFEAFFLEKGEYRNWTKYNIYPKQYDFDKTHNYRIYLGRNHELKLQDRTTAHVIAEAQKSLEEFSKWKTEAEATLEKVKNTDQEAIVKELRAIYNKYGQPVIWDAILDSYAVKYPNH